MRRLKFWTQSHSHFELRKFFMRPPTISRWSNSKLQSNRCSYLRQYYCSAIAFTKTLRRIMCGQSMNKILALSLSRRKWERSHLLLTPSSKDRLFLILSASKTVNISRSRIIVCIVCLRLNNFQGVHFGSQRIDWLYAEPENEGPKRTTDWKNSTRK